MGEVVRLLQSDLDKLLNNDAWKSFIRSMEERYESAMNIVSGTLLDGPQAIALVSKEQGAIEVIEMINGWVALTQLEIEEGIKKEEEKDA
jgi:hypothetical protein